MKYVKTFAAFINEGTVNESKQITVITYRGKFTTYKDKDIKKMIDHFSSAISSDDLPKWIYTTGMEGNPDFPKKPEKVKDLLKKILDYDDDVVIDIDSSKPLYKRNIKFIGESITEASHVAPESEEPVKDEVEEAKEEVGSNIWAIYFKYDNNHRAELPAAIVWAESSKAAEDESGLDSGFLRHCEPEEISTKHAHLLLKEYDDKIKDMQQLVSHLKGLLNK